MSDWDEYAENWDEGAPVRYAAAAADALRARLATHDISLGGARVLDFGCGTGLLTERLSPDVAHITALDPSAGMIARLRDKIAAGLGDVEALEGGLDTLLERDPQPYDLITASSVCAFLEDYPGTLTKLATLLTPGGVFCQWDWAYDEADEEPFGLTEDAISQALESAGLEVLFVGTGFEAPFEDVVMRPLMGMGRRA